MFEKLLSVLPSNPGISNQLAFYARRMREEAALRRIGLFFIVLAFFVQFFAVLAPPVATSAYSNNDLVNGPTTSKSQAVQACRNNDKSYKDVMRTFGITCDDIAAGDVVNLNSTDTDGSGHHLYSLGWLPQGQHNNNTGRDTNESQINVLNYGQPVYSRLLHSWDSADSGSNYQAVKFHANGQVYFILFGCGNLVFWGQPVPLPICPFNHNLLKTDNDCFCPFDHSLAPGDNKCYCPFNNNIGYNDAKCRCPFNDKISPSDSKCYCPFNKKISASDSKCYCPFDKTISAGDSKCGCPFNKSIPASDSKCYCPFDNTLSAQDKNCYCPVPGKTTLGKNSPDCFVACPYNSSLAVGDSRCKPCEKSLSTEDATACVMIHKSAINVTTGGSDADGTTAHAGDVITYTLYAKNNGKKDVKDYPGFVENMTDVLDYADITDLHGGTLNSITKVVTWPLEDIKAGATATHQITVKVKNPIPSTPAGSTDPQHYDLTMTNVFGNSINIKLPPPPTVVVQQTANQLPNTGPGESLAAIAVVMVVGGYFYGRARLLHEESVIAVQDAANA